MSLFAMENPDPLKPVLVMGERVKMFLDDTQNSIAEIPAANNSPLIDYLTNESIQQKVQKDSPTTDSLPTMW